MRMHLPQPLHDVVTRLQDNIIVNRGARFAARVGLFLAGVYVAFLVSFRLFPRLNAELPLFVALLGTWILTAYFLLPAFLRVVRLLFRPELVPHNTYTPDGFIADPVNLGIIGTRHQLVDAFEEAGWSVADPRTFKNSLRYTWSIISGRPYPSAPMSALYLFGRSQDLAFEKHIDGKRFHRHHVRFWAISTEMKDGKFIEHMQFWRQRLGYRRNIKLLWLGAAIKDDGLAVIRYHGQVTHSIDENTNAERDFIVEELARAVSTSVETIEGVVPARTVKNRAIGDAMASDGKIRLVDLTVAQI